MPQAPRLTLVRGPAMGPVTRGWMGCPAGGGVRPLDLLKVVQLGAGEQCQFGSWPHRPVRSSVAGWFADTVIPETVFSVTVFVFISFFSIQRTFRLTFLSRSEES